ncbi:MAG: hypothetical protein CMI54_02330 [Parcubacteria group bacterium]|nr:hypothetical protein [Parcubacteria group bacterium]|tara:strand:- start:1679 stop:2857 length:1179 start_codon:yes stop_codon:yes gene_type:complete
MKIFLNETVLEAALVRLNRIFDDFENVIVAFSGGKDSTVIFNLTMKVAEERNRLPLPVLFLDQEAEYNATVVMVREVMNDARVEPYWIQAPIRLFNATSTSDPWLYCWEEGREWMRPKEDISIKENLFGTDRFHELFNGIVDHIADGKRAALIGGVRTEESPTRLVALTHQATYKEITWGKKLNEKKNQYTFYPIYDWSLSDVWKAIGDNGWSYNKIYDIMYRYGVAPMNMRVSNLHHETAVHHLFWLHEVERETWEALTKRLGGINQTKHISKKEMLNVKELPFMFDSWLEYRNYLTDKLITVPEQLAKFKKRWKIMDLKYKGMRGVDDLHRRQVNSLLVNDWEGVKLSGFINSPPVVMYRKWKSGKLDPKGLKKSNLKYIPKWAWPKEVA